MSIRVAIALLLLCVAILIFVPSWFMWRSKRSALLPVMWMGFVLVVLGGVALFLRVQMSAMSRPIPIYEKLEDAQDATGSLRVTSLRLMHPELSAAKIEADVENSGSEPCFLGMQYLAESGKSGAGAPRTRSGASTFPVAPNWTGTITLDASLPEFGYGGTVVIVLAKCNTAIPTGTDSLPDDSEALYQHRFTLIADPQAANQNKP